MHTPGSLSQKIKEQAKVLGFDACGITNTAPLEEAWQYYESYIADGRNGSMKWLEANGGKRKNPALLVEGCKSVICLISNYFPEDESPSKGRLKIARYAYGKDYHKVLKKKAKQLIPLLEKLGSNTNRIFVDSVPAFEKALAQRAGLGWIGKNCLLIRPGMGSYFFLTEIFCDLELYYDKPVENLCEDCHFCLDACPTGALISGNKLDARKCLSYQNIESEEPSFTENSGWVYGCDECQQACPHNSFAVANTEKEFQAGEHLKYINESLCSKGEVFFNRHFSETVFKRRGFKKICRNIRKA